MRENKIMLQKICRAKSKYPTRTFLKDWKSMHEAEEYPARLSISLFDKK